MQAAPNLSPAQLFENARRAVQDGQLALAEQFLRHVVAIAPQSPEGAAAQQELGRLLRHRAQVEPTPMPAHPALGAPTGHQAGGQGPYGPPGYAPGGPAPQMASPAPGGQNAVNWAEPAPGPRQSPLVQPQLGPPGGGAQAPMGMPQPTLPGPNGGPAYGYNELSVPHADPHERMPTVVTNGRKAKKRGAAEAAPPAARAQSASELEAPRSYQFGRFIAAIVGLLGWLATLGGLAALLASVAALAKIKLPFLPLLALGIVPAAQIFGGGLALILIRQMARASFDAANHAYAAAAYAQMVAQQNETTHH